MRYMSLMSREQSVISAKMAIVHWLHIHKKRLSKSGPRRKFFYSLIMKALKSTDEIYFIKTEQAIFGSSISYII